MLKILDQFRSTLDDIMLQAMHRRIVLNGYGYTGRFLKWYAEYYHSIKIDYIVSLDMRLGQAYDSEIFRKSLFDFHYKDVEDAVVWLAEPMDDEIASFLKEKGYIKDKTFFDFYEAMYGNDVNWESENTDVFNKRKSGKRDIQFLEWMEWKYQCNFVTAIERENLPVAGEHGAAYRVTTQKEIFPILDRCHCIPTEKDAIFDYGCGKGGAMVSFLDYGFMRIGGVEYEPQIYDILVDNMSKLNLKDNRDIECIQGNAAEIREQLDKYNWFFFFNPFDDYIFRQCIDNMCESLKRCERKIHIISIAPNSYRCIEETGRFRLTNQFTIDSRQRVVDVFESYVRTGI